MNGAQKGPNLGPDLRRMSLQSEMPVLMIRRIGKPAAGKIRGNDVMDAIFIGVDTSWL